VLCNQCSLCLMIYSDTCALWSMWPLLMPNDQHLRTHFMINVIDAWWLTQMHTFYNRCGRCPMFDSNACASWLMQPMSDQCGQGWQ
jgi:hypothetical protein